MPFLSWAGESLSPDHSGTPLSERTNILAEPDARALQQHGLLRRGENDETQRLHKRLLNDWGHEEYKHLPRRPRPSSPEYETVFATIPTFLESVEALEYMGLSAQKAREIWAEWTLWDVGDRIKFIDFTICEMVCDVNASSDDDDDDDDEWLRCLDTCGMAQSAQDVIMDPAFADIRRSHSCIYWVHDTILMRYHGLKDIRTTSIARWLMQSPGYLAAITSPLEPEETDESYHVVDTSLWSSEVATETAGEDRIVLFKATDQGRISILFEESRVRDDIFDSPDRDEPSDSSFGVGWHYLFADRKVAECYAGYAKRRANLETIVMTVMHGPKAAINNGIFEDLEMQRLGWLSDEWKQLVWSNRGSHPAPEAIENLKDTTVIIGNVPRGSGEMYEDMEWDEVDESCVLHVGSGNSRSPVVQWAISCYKGRDWVQSNDAQFRGYVFTESDLERVSKTEAE